MFGMLHYRVNINRKMVKNSFIHHSFEAMNNFSRKNAPKKIYFLTDFIKTYLCALLDDGIGK